MVFLDTALSNTGNMTSVTDIRSASARLFADIWRPLVSVITTLYYVAIIFHHRVWCRTLFSAARIFRVRTSSSTSRLPTCQILFLLQTPLLN